MKHNRKTNSRLIKRHRRYKTKNKSNKIKRKNNRRNNIKKSRIRNNKSRRKNKKSNRRNNIKKSRRRKKKKSRRSMSLNRINYPRAGVLEHDDPSLLMHEWYTRESVDRFLAKNCEKLAYAIRRSNYDNIIKYQKEILIADFTNFYRKSIYNLIFLLNQSVGDIADVILSGGDGLNYILPKTSLY